MAIIIHGFIHSICTQRVLTTCLELGVPYTFRNIDFLHGEHKSPSFMELHPWGRVPVLEDDGFKIFESRAICKYLATKYGSNSTALMPEIKDLKKYGLFEQACSIEQSYYDSAVSAVVFEKVFKAKLGLGPINESLVAESSSKLDASLKVYNGILAKQKYLAGDEFTLADLFHLPYGRMAIEAGLKETFEKYVNVWAWWERISGRESWKNVIAEKV